jgi:hypothetical protein
VGCQDAESRQRHRCREHRSVARGIPKHLNQAT